MCAHSHWLLQHHLTSQNRNISGLILPNIVWKCLVFSFPWGLSCCSPLVTTRLREVSLVARVSAGGAVGLASRGSAEARGWTIWLVVASWLGWEVVGCKSFRAGVGSEVWSNEPAPTGGLGKGAIRGWTDSCGVGIEDDSGNWVKWGQALVVTCWCVGDCYQWCIWVAVCALGFISWSLWLVCRMCTGWRIAGCLAQ